MAFEGLWSLLSVVKWRERLLLSAFHCCGLQQRNVQVDPHTSIACWCGPAKPDDFQTKPSLVLIHGFGGSSIWQWEHQVKPLLQHFQVFLPDLIFFGKSSTLCHDRSEIFQARMIALAMDKMGVKTYSIVGISYGGFVAFRLAQMFPDRVEKVVIVSSGICMTPKDTKEMLDRAGVDNASDFLLPQSPAALRTLMKMSFQKPFPFLPAIFCNDVIQNFYIKHRQERIDLLANLQIGRQDQEPLPTLLHKTLIIWGDKDGIFPLELAYRLKEHLKDHAELAVIKNAAHAVQIENPQEFNRLIQRFLLQDITQGSKGKMS